jgi:N-acetylmuramoyl-L-alanine amidase
MRFPSRFRISWLAIGLLTFPGLGGSMARGEWATTDINELSYVALEDFAAAFAMEPAKRRKGKGEIGYAGETHQLVVKTGTREVIVDGVRHWLAFPVIAKGARAYVALADISTTLSPAMTPLAVKEIGKVKTIVFDPGHGGHDRGGKSAYGYENDYTLDVVKRARRILEAKKVKVVQTRLGDTFVDLAERPQMTENYDDPIFVSVHFNFADWKPSATGIEVYALPPLGLPITGKAPDPILDRRECSGNAMEPASFVLANTMQHTLLGKTTGFDRGVKRARYAVLRHCDAPSILIEGAFLTNVDEAKNIHSGDWRESFAQAIADGILAYMALANEKRPPASAGAYGRKSTDEFIWEE